MNRLSIADILRGTEPGRMQSVGHMQIIPLLGDDDDRFAPPDVEIRTSAYGTVELRNEGDRPTIIPPGAGWVVKQRAQDHGLGGGLLLAGKSLAKVDTARCIQQSQPGYISTGKHPMLVLPAALRTQALAIRREVGYTKLWEPIAAFNASLGASRVGHLEHFLDRFKAELDRFVAEFELLPRQLGAIVLVGGRVVGVERAPSTSFWRSLWEPLIRVCYGSLAIERALAGSEPPPTRVPLAIGATSIAEIRSALAEAAAREREVVATVLEGLGALELTGTGEPEQVLERAELRTLASTKLAGQIVHEGRAVAYASLCTGQLGGEEQPAASKESRTGTWLQRLRDWVLG